MDLTSRRYTQQTARMIESEAAFFRDGTITFDTHRVPKPQKTQVCIEVIGAGLNRADVLQRKGFYPAPSGAPQDIPGLEFVGRICQIGNEVSRYSIGDVVMGITAGGAMARHLLTCEDLCVGVPKAESYVPYGGVPEVFFTAFDAMVLQGGMAPGSTVLVHAIGSGIGTAAIQIAENFGAKLIGTSRSAEKLRRARELGSVETVLVENGKFSDAVLALGGADVILDTVGAAYIGENLRSLRHQGRVVTIGLLGGVKGELNLGMLLRKRATWTGSVLRSRSHEEKAALTSAFQKQLLPSFQTGKLRPVVTQKRPMLELAKAHEAMEQNETFGKIVLYW